MLLALFLSFPPLIIAQIVPTAPNEGQTFYTGQDCSISWSSDNATDGWKLMRIDLLFGDKSDANVISNVVESVDSVATTSVSWTCPSVDFDGPSYRYLFSSLEKSDSVVISKQFTIMSFNGSVDIPSAEATTSGADPSTTQVADPSNGAANLASPANAPPSSPDSESGEQLLEEVDPSLGGSDSKPSIPDSSNDNPFAQELRNAIASGRAVEPSDDLDHVDHINVIQPESNENAAVRGSATAPPLSASTRMVVLYSSANTSSSTFVGGNRTATDNSFRQTSSLQGFLGALLFAICIGHFVV